MKEFISRLYRPICLYCLVILSNLLSAQDITVVSPEEILKQRQEVFSQIIALNDPYKDSLWYNGRIYEFKIKSQTGTPYFFNLGTMPGSLIYNKKSHDELILSYNLVMDELIYRGEASGGASLPIVLNKYFVDEFTLKYNDNDYHFRLHTEMNPIHDRLKEGFYEVVFDDEFSMFVKHTVELSYDATNVEYYSYKHMKQVYLIRDEKIYVIHNRRDYLNAFQEEKKALRKKMRKENVNFDKSDTKALRELCTYSKSLLD